MHLKQMHLKQMHLKQMHLKQMHPQQVCCCSYLVGVSLQGQDQEDLDLVLFSV